MIAKAASLALTLLLALPVANAAGEALTLSREEAIAAARAAVARGDLDAASALYRRILAAPDARGAGGPSDDEARAALARIDAWQGRLADAEAALAAVLARHPRDAEVRASLADVLGWRGRRDEANRLVDEGLALDADAPALLARRALARHRRGDEADAIDDADHAERLAPADADLGAIRDRLAHGQAQLTGRLELYSGGRPTLSGVEASAFQHLGRFTLGVRTDQGERLASVDGGKAYNGAYGLFSRWVARPSLALELEAGFGAPTTSLPNFYASLAGELALPAGFGARLGYGHREYPGSIGVDLIAPQVSWSPNDSLTFVARYWLGLVRTSDASNATHLSDVHAGGVGVTVRRSSRVALGFDYAYGAELDATAELYRVTTVRAHVFDGWLDWLVARSFGLRPSYRFEARSTGAVDYQVHAFELALYTRW